MKSATMNASEKIRNSNLEIFRIFTMILIVAHHYVVNSGLTGAEGPLWNEPFTWRTVFLLLFGGWGKIGINCFVLITGYFMCKSQITVIKFIKLLGEIVFYKILFYLIFLLSGYEPFSLKTLVKAILPITSVKQNFTGCFLLFYLCIPFLNILINNITERQHLKVLLLLTFCYILFGTIHGVSMNYVSWFCVLYMISSYIRLYTKKIFENTLFWCVMMILSVLLSTLSVLLCSMIDIKHSFVFVTDSNTFFAVLTGISSFMFFKNVKIKNSKFVNKVSASTFGVLLIHANSDTMRRWLWRDTLQNVQMYYSPYLVLHAILSVICIFIVCTLIDWLRIKFVEKYYLKIVDKYIDSLTQKYNSIENKICEYLQIGKE